MAYNSIKVEPTNELVEIIDELGNIYHANPTFYDFKVEGKGVNRKTVVCEEYWDGGWLIEYSLEDFKNNQNSKIVGWRKIN